MQYGLCHLSVVAVRTEPSHSAEMVTQLLFGDHFKITEERKHWSKVRNHHDACEGWVPNKQLQKIDSANFEALGAATHPALTTDLVSHCELPGGLLLPLVLGSRLDSVAHIGARYDEEVVTVRPSKPTIIENALLYLNTPFLWGGKTHFGIDAPGFTQMAYRLSGFALPRDTEQQANRGEALSFLEESEPGDLAFFDNKEGVIDHVGSILKDNYIIHAHGQVRIDRIDHTGIFNTEAKLYSHQLRVIKKVV